MLSEQQIKYILELAKERNFLRASENCFVTQPTLSMQIKKAEDLLGSKIFDRSRNPLELTPFGLKILPFLQEIEASYKMLAVYLQSEEKGVKELIKIGIIPTVSNYLLPKMFPLWKKGLEGVQLEIVELKTEEMLTEFERRNIDLCILAGPVDQHLGLVNPLYQEEIKVFLQKKKTETLDPEELCTMQPWLLSKGNCLRTQMVHFCKLSEAQGQDKWNYQGGSIDLLIKMVQLNGGYTLVPEFHPLSANDRKQLVSVMEAESGERPARQIISLTSKKTFKRPHLEWLIRSIQFEYASRANEKLKILNWR